MDNLYVSVAFYRSMKKSIFLLIFSLFSCVLFAQNIATLSGTVYDMDNKKPVDFATVHIKGTQIVTETDLKGNFKLTIPANKSVILVCNRVGYFEKEVTISKTIKNTIRKVEFYILSKESNLDITIRDSRMKDLGMVREETEVLTIMPTTSGNLESVLPSIALGASGGSAGELSSQYNVRGGNYDENLIYVNDFEIFRPQLIRSGQQEGLTFPNMDLIKDLSFSSGGFQPKYGDKLSSVLDVRYKRPDLKKHSVSFSLLGASAHTEGKLNVFGKPLRYLFGGRYKTSKYLLGSLDLKGEYQPNHGDIQAYLTYDLNQHWQIELLSNYNISQYNFVPKSGSSTTGNIGLNGFNIRLNTLYEGAERDQFLNAMTGLGLTYLSNREKNPFFLKLLVAGYRGKEEENFDIIGRYRLSEIETNLGAENVGEEINVLGAGTQHRYARNRLESTIWNIQHRGGIDLGQNQHSSHFIQWNAKVQHEVFRDNLKEWERLDSSGYSLPYSTDGVYLPFYLKTKNTTNEYRFTSFIQDTYAYQDSIKEIKVILGARLNYWTWNKELFVSPRFQFLYKPLNWSSDLSFKIAAGLYSQPPFYRELRRPDGTLNRDIKSQKSAHFVVGLTYDFMWKKVSEKPLRLITEIYCKPLWDIIPYDVDNVRIQYQGENVATGYAFGIDARINGEFVPGAESWINFSLLRTRESWKGIEHFDYDEEGKQIVVKNVPRPSDQLFAMNMFFQDYLPKMPKFKAHLNLALGTGLPFGFKGDNIVNRNPFRFAGYKRVDIGFSYLLWNDDWLLSKPSHPLRWTRNAWISLEVFNLMNISNIASYNWIKSIYNVQYPIPNRLTSRRINLKLRFDF